MSTVHEQVTESTSVISAHLNLMQRLAEDADTRHENAAAAGAELAAAVSAYLYPPVESTEERGDPLVLGAAYQKFMAAHSGGFA